MELGSQNHSRDGLLGPTSIMVVYMDPLGYIALKPCILGYCSIPKGSVYPYSRYLGLKVAIYYYL